MLSLISRNNKLFVSISANSLKVRSLYLIKRINFSNVPDVKENYLNKEVYIMSQWRADFPTHASLTYKEVSELSSRSRDLNRWFKEKSNDFILFKEAPEWFLNSGKEPSDWTKEVQGKLILIKTLNKDYANKVNEISSDARSKMDKLDSEHKIKLINVLNETPDLVIELINSQMLPFEIHLKAFEYNTKEEAKAFIDKETRIFKQVTYERFLSGELSSSQLIDLLFTK